MSNGSVVICQARSPFSFPKASANVRYRSLTSGSNEDFCQPSASTTTLCSTLHGPRFSTAELANNFYNGGTFVLDAIMIIMASRHGMAIIINNKKGKKKRKENQDG